MSKITYANKTTLNLNTDIPATQKCQSGDLNSIKNAVNQNGSFTTLVAGSTAGHFNCTLEGTLGAGDIINVYFPTQTTNLTSNVELSVNGGTNYYEVTFSDLTNILVNELQGKYISLIFNGTEFILDTQNTSITLYESTTGTTGNVTLSDSSANYSSIEITFTKAGAYETQKVFNPNGKDVTLVLPNWYASSSLQILYKKVNINGISITFLYGGYILTVNGTTTQSDENNIAIVKVVGYK